MDQRLLISMPLRPSSLVKGWGGHMEETRFESQWGQRMKKRKQNIYLPKKKKKIVDLHESSVESQRTVSRLVEELVIIAG